MKLFQSIVLIFISLNFYAQVQNLIPRTIFTKKEPKLIDFNYKKEADLNRGDLFFEKDSTSLTYRPRSSGWSFGLDYRKTQISNGEIALEDGSILGDSLEGLQLNIGKTFKAKDQSDWALSVSFGSDSDDLFRRSSDNTIQVGIVNIRPGDKNRWVFGAFYNSNFIAGNFPLPVIAYYYKPSKNFEVLVGLPFLSLLWGNFFKDSLFILATPGNARIIAAKSIYGPAAFFVGAETISENFQDFNRVDRDERLFIQRTNIFLGIRSPLSRKTLLSLTYGIRTDSEVFQAEGRFDDAESFELENSNYVSLDFTLRY